MNIVLLKEKKGDDDPYNLALRELGPVQFISVLSINFVNIEQLQNLLVEGNCSTVIFTSGNSVKAMKQAFEAIPPDIVSRCQQLQCYAVGKATAKSASELGFKCRGCTSGNAEDLAKLIIQENSSKPTETFLFPCGQLKREILPTMLKEAGFTLTSVTVYETTASQDIHQEISRYKSQCSEPTILVFFSPSGVKFSLPKFKELYGDDLKDLYFAAIGKTTADALKNAGLEPCCVAEQPTPEDLAHAIKVFLNSMSKKAWPLSI